MRHATLVSLTFYTLVIGSVLVASAQVPSAGDMQQKLDQEMANAKRSATESSSSARQGAGNVKSEAERKLEETEAQHKSQAEGKLTEAIEKAKRKSQESGH
jgi:F0F1-type ATP synthase membrane subunit b/b'